MVQSVDADEVVVLKLNETLVNPVSDTSTKQCLWQVMANFRIHDWEPVSHFTRCNPSVYRVEKVYYNVYYKMAKFTTFPIDDAERLCKMIEY